MMPFLCSGQQVYWKFLDEIEMNK